MVCIIIFQYYVVRAYENPGSDSSGLIKSLLRPCFVTAYVYI